MVAPTRMPQARGVKCDLCKKILSLATWLDQTKLAKDIEDAKNVLTLIKQHNITECPCIPKNIENLLVGSTHFEIHRLIAKELDQEVHKQQVEYFAKVKQKQATTTNSNKNEAIHTFNDCFDTRKGSRFKIYTSFSDKKNCDWSHQQIWHLRRAIDYWKTAMEDGVNPFNSKLALRLGLTHHVIYACYLFKYNKILDYQLISSNLLLNLFKSIEGVTANAMLHANFLLIRTLIDCNQLQLAHSYLKQAVKYPNYQEKSYYESILLTCAACELNLLEGEANIYSLLDEVEELSHIKTDDKLQHYYARVTAMSLLIKYIHCFPKRSEQCFEFFHTFRYMCAIIRRCYNDAFELILSDPNSTVNGEPESGRNQSILDHSWIKFAVCDFVYSTFDLLVEFYCRAGMPESLELLYGGLNLIAFRNGSFYWQSRIILNGSRLDLLCDRYEFAKRKLDCLSKLVAFTNEPHLTELLKLESEVMFLTLSMQQECTNMGKEKILDLMQRIRDSKNSQLEKLSHIELFDCKTNSNIKIDTHYESSDSDQLVVGNNAGKLSLRVLKLGIVSMLRREDSSGAQELMAQISNQLSSANHKVLEFYDCQILLEIMISFANIERSKYFLLDATRSRESLFLELDDKIASVRSHLSSLSLNGDNIDKPQRTARGAKKLTNLACKAKASNLSRIPLGFKAKGTYDVASKSQENLHDTSLVVKAYDALETIVSFSQLSKEELVVSYLRNSEPNPDYLIYRQAHELMFCFRAAETTPNHDQLLYHFCESATSNTMRYRWMMFEEQLVSPYEMPKPNFDGAPNNPCKHLGFCSSPVMSEKLVRTFTRSIPDDYKLIQMKHILDERDNTEHLLCVSIEGSTEPVYVHKSRVIVSDDYFEDAHRVENELTLPNRLSDKVEAAKVTLFNTNQRSRLEQRKEIENDLDLIMRDVENDWFGPFRFLLCGRICDIKYNSLISGLIETMQSIMKGRQCNSNAALRLLLENAPLLSRYEFLQILSSLFNCSSDTRETIECFDKWLELIEAHAKDHNPKLEKKKLAYLQTLTRGQVGLILDSSLELIPFESLPIVRATKQGIFRVPSLRIFSILSSRRCLPIKVNVDDLFYMLDPASNLIKTRQRFEKKLSSKTGWHGTIGAPPDTNELELWLARKQLYVFIGHGAGTVYYNKLCKGRGLSAMNHIESGSIVMGCSSGRVQAEGPNLESFGINWVFVFRGAPCYVGLLWDVTDTDIDKFLDSLLLKWMPNKWISDEENCEHKAVGSAFDANRSLLITDAMAHAREVCQFRLLVGSTPVLYGLPIKT